MLRWKHKRAFPYNHLKIAGKISVIFESKYDLFSLTENTITTLIGKWLITQAICISLLMKKKKKIQIEKKNYKHKHMFVASMRSCMPIFHNHLATCWRKTNFLSHWSWIMSFHGCFAPLLLIWVKKNKLQSFVRIVLQIKYSAIKELTLNVQTNTHKT